MAAELSALARLLQKGAFEEFNTGLAGPRGSPLPPALPGMVRGTLGSRGAQLFRGRNSDAKEQRERQFMQSPIFAAFMDTFRRVK